MIGVLCGNNTIASPFCLQRRWNYQLWFLLPPLPFPPLLLQSDNGSPFSIDRLNLGEVILKGRERVHPSKYNSRQYKSPTIINLFNRYYMHLSPGCTLTHCVSLSLSVGSFVCILPTLLYVIPPSSSTVSLFINDTIRSLFAQSIASRFRLSVLSVPSFYPSPSSHTVFPSAHTVL